MSQGRITFAEPGNFLELSAPATADRVRRLEEKGVIKGYSAIVNPQAVGCGLTSFITVTLEHRDPFLRLVADLAEVQECHHITGDEDYIRLTLSSFVSLFSTKVNAGLLKLVNILSGAVLFGFGAAMVKSAF